jgi:hypothetical protein
MPHVCPFTDRALELRVSFEQSLLYFINKPVIRHRVFAFLVSLHTVSRTISVHVWSTGSGSTGSGVFFERYPVKKTRPSFKEESQSKSSRLLIPTPKYQGPARTRVGSNVLSIVETRL